MNLVDRIHNLLCLITIKSVRKLTMAMVTILNMKIKGKNIRLTMLTGTQIKVGIVIDQYMIRNLKLPFIFIVLRIKMNYKS